MLYLEQTTKLNLILKKRRYSLFAQVLLNLIELKLLQVTTENYHQSHIGKKLLPDITS